MSDARPGTVDFLTPCTSVSLSNPVLEQIQARAAEVVLAVHRIARISLVHAMNNEAVSATIATSHKLLTAFMASIAADASVVFIHDTIFVCGELLRASRGVYESAVDLGAILARCGVSELTFGQGVTPADLFRFAELLSTSVRDIQRAGALLDAKIPNVTVRPIEKLLAKREDERELSLRERALRAYASAVFVVRTFYDAMAAGAVILPQRVKRVAQKLVILAEESESTLLGMTTLSQAQRDDAIKAVHAAILAVVVSRQLTRDRHALSKLAMAALLADAGRAQVTGQRGRDRLIALSERETVAVPRCSGAVGFVTGGVNSASALRSVLAFETTWMEQGELLGPLYRGRMEPLFQSQVLRLVRALLDLVAPRDLSRARSPFDALCCLAEQRWVDRALLRALVTAVGLFPPGTLVELETGERGVVLGPSETPGARHLPRVHLLSGPGPAVIERDVDLGSADPAMLGLKIRRVLSAESLR
jgi:hypothetical protein